MLTAWYGFIVLQPKPTIINKETSRWDEVPSGYGIYKSGAWERVLYQSRLLLGNDVRVL